jgi:hypothetical protein
MVDVTIAIELDAFPEETSYVLEVDRDGSPPEDGAGGGWTASAMRAAIDGESHVPLRTFAYGEGNAARAVRVAQNVVYRLTLLDGGADGLLPRRSSSGGDGDGGDDGDGGESPSRFRMCHGVVDADECLNASLESDLVVCYGTGDFQLARSISCPVNMQKPPTFAPFEIPLEFYMDDDRIRPATNAPSHAPSIPPTKTPSNSTFVDGSTFVGGTFLTKPATPAAGAGSPAVPAGQGDGGASDDATIDKPAKADDGGASSSPSRGTWVTSVISALVISTVCFAK